MSGTTTPLTPAETRADTINTWGRVVVSAVIVLSFLLTLALVMTKAVAESQTTGYMVNTLGTLTAAVVYYWVGSSAGSTAKDAKMATMTPPVPPGAASTTTTITPPVSPAPAAPAAQP